MKQYAGDYSKYMQQGSGSDSSKASGGDYDKYMKQYAADFSQYTAQGASSGGDYSKYMKQYSGGAGSSSSGNYEKYMKQYASDYSKYQKGGGADSYSQYMKQYAGAYTGGSSKEEKSSKGTDKPAKEAADSMELVQQSGADSAGGFDYKKYTQGFTANVKNMSDQDEVRD